MLMRTLALGVSILLLLPGAGQAQESSSPTSIQASYPGLNPREAQDVLLDPGLVDNAAWLSRHPDFVAWMQAHPDLAQQLIAQAQLSDVTSTGVVSGAGVGFRGFRGIGQQGITVSTKLPTSTFAPGTVLGPNGLPLGTGTSGFGVNGQPLPGNPSIIPLGPNGLPLAQPTPGATPHTGQIELTPSNLTPPPTAPTALQRYLMAHPRAGTASPPPSPALRPAPPSVHRKTRPFHALHPSPPPRPAVAHPPKPQPVPKKKKH